MTRWLIDTGPLVAYVDGADPAHGAVSRHLDRFKGRLHTTAAVLAEAMYLVSGNEDGPAVLAEFLMSTGTSIAAMTEPGQLEEAVRLMRRYRDTPMDYADATLVMLANDLDVADIVTLDRRGFRTYRLENRSAFRLVLPN